MFDGVKHVPLFTEKHVYTSSKKSTYMDPHLNESVSNTWRSLNDLFILKKSH